MGSSAYVSLPTTHNALPSLVHAMNEAPHKSGRARAGSLRGNVQCLLKGSTRLGSKRLHQALARITMLARATRPLNELPR
eukprot:364586-Chlamydomonas_euryale.AAC.5